MGLQSGECVSSFGVVGIKTQGFLIVVDRLRDITHLLQGGAEVFVYQG